MNTTNITLLTLVSTSPPVAPNFCGLSIEVPATPEMLLAPAATLLAHLYETTPAPHAGPVLRIGGNSADSSCFESNASGCKHAIQRDVILPRARALGIVGQLPGFQGNAPIALKTLRAAMRGDIAEQVRLATNQEGRDQFMCQQTNDHKEGVKAVAERRVGNFTGT